jgi:hypothetical protein
VLLRTFNFFGNQLPYIQQGQPFVGDGCNERTVERPIADLWLSKHDPAKVVEVGAVTPMLWDGEKYKNGVTAHVTHNVVDPWDLYPECIRTDAMDYYFRGKYVLCLSTLEHIGLIEYGNTYRDPTKGAQLFRKIQNESDGFLVSWPVGENPALDYLMAILYVDFTPCFMLKRISADNEWEMASVDWKIRYDYPYPCGNAVVFLTNTLEWVN